MSSARLSVSLVVPAYNHAAYLEQAIESVLAQTHPGIEVIVLDDGSTDETAAKLAKYADRFHVESQANMGQAATLNKGWRMARGEVLGYLSADDYLHPRAVAEAVAALESHPEVMVVYPDFALVNEISAVTGTVVAPEFEYGDMVLRLVCPPGPGAFFRRTVFDIEGGWNESLRRIPDFDFWLRAGLCGPFLRIPQILAYYRVHAGAQSFSPVDPVRADEYTRVMSTLYRSGRLPEAIASRESEAVATSRLYSARLHLVSGRYLAAWQRCLSAFRGSPEKLLEVQSWRLLASGIIWRMRVRSRS